jgi:tRNA pseudouridine38/39 synthase
MIAILFLIGQGLEKPSIITSLFDIEKVSGKPNYEMADDRPLVLWDCVFPENELEWVYPSGDLLDPVKSAKVKIDRRRDHYLIDVLWENWHKRKLEETLSGKLLEVTLADVYKRNTCKGTTDSMSSDSEGEGKKKSRKKETAVMIMDGTSKPGYKGSYKPILERERNDDVEVINQRYRDKKGEAFWAAKKAKFNDSCD